MRRDRPREGGREATTWILHIPHWRPALTNELLRSVGARIRLKQRDRHIVWAYAQQAKIPAAAGRRRVSLHLTLGTGMRACDYDAPWKSLHDALTQARLLIDDSTRYVEQGPLTFSRHATQWGTTIWLTEC